jgi:iron complex transport system permease protein
MKFVRKKPRLRALILVFMPIVAAILCMGIGRLYISPPSIVGNLFKIATEGRASVDSQTYNVLINVRLPRIILALLCGAGLAVAGGAFQSIFANALATPDTLGVAAGASFGAALALFLNFNMFMVQIMGMAMGFLAVVLTTLISSRQGVMSIIMVLLSGLVIAALFESGISIVKVFADPNAKLPAITFWLMGSLAGVSYRGLLMASPFIVGGILIIFLLRWRLNILTLNEDEAKSMGVNLFAMRLTVTLAATMITAACVALCGQVGWIGLLIPHVCRMLFGSNNREMIPSAISLGAVFLLAVDTFARAATAAEIPISILTAVIGAPLFIILLRKTGGAHL